MRIKYFYFIALAVFVIDIATKMLTDGVIYAPAIPGLFSIESHHNTGASFSIFAGSTAAQILFIIFAIIFAVGIVLFDCFNKTVHTNGWFVAGATLMLGGIVGNLYDRIFFGYVRDFISLDFMNFAIFNVADMALCVGVVCVAVWLLFFSTKKETKEENGTSKIES